MKLEHNTQNTSTSTYLYAYCIYCTLTVSEVYLNLVLNRKNYQSPKWSVHGKRLGLPMDRPLWGLVVLPVEYKIQANFTYGECTVYTVGIKIGGCACVLCIML